MRKAIGIDFGTTNSALAVADQGGSSRLATFESEEESALTTFRSILYFSAEERGADRRPLIVAGPDAIRKYLEADGKGRLMQSMKSHLSSRSFTHTTIFGRNYTLDDLITILLRKLREAAEKNLGEFGRKAVIGRPVHFVGAKDEDDDDFALNRLKLAAEKAGFEEVRFEFEPVAAAYQYEQNLDHDELVLIGDFGGGTSDFSLIRLGPTTKRERDKRGNILSNGGVGIAGDALDGEIVMALVAPRLGLGSHYRSMEKLLPMPSWLYKKLSSWHQVSFLKDHQTTSLLTQIRPQSLEPEKIDALLHIIWNDLGYKLYRSTEQAKVELSNHGMSLFFFKDSPVEIREKVRRLDFETWIQPAIGRIENCVERLLESCHVKPSDVDSVFLTGGSAFVPAIRRVFKQKFGADRLRGGEELTTVARGLALRALAE
ncbi:MAG TPA: Hsp70 family protein [Blastocatellia bacterium]|nr:Hsp70 family protein [Blastocatellia bacterium]